MSFLLDTHALLWWLFDDPGLSQNARAIIADPSNRMLVSSASAWEIATKHRLGKLPAAEQLVQDLAGWVSKAGFLPLPIQIRHAEHAGRFPQPHRDPFDRMLAAQSLLEDCSLISRDRQLDPFGVTRIW